MEVIPTKAESKYSTETVGGPYVMTPGEKRMRLLFVDNWNSPIPMHKFGVMLHLVKVKELYGLTTLDVRVQKTGWMNAFMMDGEVMIVNMLKMQVSYVVRDVFSLSFSSWISL